MLSSSFCFRQQGKCSRQSGDTDRMDGKLPHGRRPAAFGLSVSAKWRTSRARQCQRTRSARARTCPVAVSILNSDESLPARKLSIPAEQPTIDGERPKLTTRVDKKWFVPLAGSIVHALHATCVYLGPATLLSPMRQEMNLSVSEISIPLNVYRLINSIFLVPVGMLLDRIGAQRPVKISIIAAVVLSFLLPLCTTVWQLTVVQGLLAITKLFGGITPLLMLTSRWFTCQKGMGTATSVLLGGYSLAGFLAPLAMGVVGNQFGWRLSSTMMAAVFGVVSIPLTLLFLRERDESADAKDGPKLSGSDARETQAETVPAVSRGAKRPLFTATYIAVILIVASYSMSLHIILDHLMIFLTEESSFPLERASIYVSTLNLVAFGTKVMAGILSERVDKGILMPLFGALCALGSTILVYTSIVGLSAPGAILWFFAFILIYSVGYAGVFNLTMTCLPDFGMDRLGTRSNLNLVILFAFGSVGSYLAGMLRTAFGKYTLSFGLNSAACFLVLVFSLLYKFLSDRDKTRGLEHAKDSQITGN